MEYTYVLVNIVLDGLDNTGLMTKGDSSEELSQHQLVDIGWSTQNLVSCFIHILGRELLFIW